LAVACRSVARRLQANFRLISLVGALASAVLIADVGTSAVLARKTYPTAFDRWLGPAAAQLGPSATLTIEYSAISRVIDGDSRATLRRQAQAAASLAGTLRGQGTPPANGADVDALIHDLLAYASAANALSICATPCEGAIQSLDQQLAALTVSMDHVHAHAAPHRGAGILKKSSS
jgi:hypothetical protein